MQRWLTMLTTQTKEITKSLLCLIQNLFQGFIIQIHGAFFLSNPTVIRDILENLPFNKFSLINLRDVDDQQRAQYSQSLKISYDIPIFILPNVSAKETYQNKIYRVS